MNPVSWLQMTNMISYQGLVRTFLSRFIKEKTFFTIGEVSSRLEIEPHVLRFWEVHFPDIQPIKRRGRRMYNKDNIERIRVIKKLLYEDGLTIKGVKKILTSSIKKEEYCYDRTKEILSILDFLERKLNGA